MTEPSHLDLDALADHLAGELDAGDHLAACTGCTARLAELEAADREVVAALRDLPVPPLPADVADRISRALAAEAPVASRGRATVTPLGPARRERTWVPAAAAAAVLAFGGLIGYGVVSGSGGSDDASTGTAAPAAGAAEDRAAGFPTVASGADYADAAAVRAALPRVLAGTAPAPAAEAAPDPAAAVAPDPLARLLEPAALADCLAAVLDPATPDERPLALDVATYAGAPALAVVLADPDPAKLSVFVVGPDCSRADDDLQFFTRVDRP